MNIKEGGATPKKVPTQKGSRGTPITGETILINLREGNNILPTRQNIPKLTS